MVTNNETPNTKGCSAVLKACSVVTAILIVLFIVVMVVAMRVPSIRSSADCRMHMQSVSEAIARYKDHNGHRPARLSELNDYLADTSALRCPLDRSRGDAPSYKYNPKARAKEVMLECDRHMAYGHEPGPAIVVLGNGTMPLLPPNWDQTAKPRRVKL